MPSASSDHPSETHRLLIPVGLVIIALQLCHRAWALAMGYFYTDDYVLLMDAHRHGLTGSYLLEAYNSHLMPATRLIYWLVDSAGPLNWGLALTITLLLQAAASLACLWMLVTLFGRRWLVLVLLTLYVTSAITAQATLWWVSSVNQISIQVSFFLVVGSWVRYLRTRRPRWLGASALALAVGLLFFQKSLLVLPVLTFLALVYFAEGSLVRRLVFLIRTYRAALVVMGVVAGSYAVYLLVAVEQPFVPKGRQNLLALTWHMMSAAAVGALGGPWRWHWHEGGAWVDTPLPLTLLAIVVVAAVAALAVLTRRRAGWAWLLLTGYLAMLILLVATSRTPVFGAGIGLAYRFQTDVAAVMVLCLGLAFAPVRGALHSSEPRRQIRGPEVLARAVAPLSSPLWRATAAGLVAFSGLVCWTTYALSWHDHTASRGYLLTLDRDLRAQGTTALADGPVPDFVLPAAFFTPQQRRLSGFVDLLDRSAEFPRSTPRLALVTRDGGLHRAWVDPSAANRPGPNPNCGWLALPPRVRIPLTARTLDLDWWVRIGYLSTSTDDVVVTLGDENVRSQVFDGLGTLYVRASGTFDAVVISDLSPDTKLCVDVIQVGTLEEGPPL